MRIFVVVLLLFFILSVGGQSNRIQDVQIPYISSNMNIDGNLSDWSVFFFREFADTGSVLHQVPGHTLMPFYDETYNYAATWKPLSRNKVKVMACWDLSNLYFAFQVKDQHVFSQNVSEGLYPNLHLNDGVEVYLDTRNDSDKRMDINDYQFMVDVTNQSLVFRGDRELRNLDTLAAPKKSGQNVYFQSATRIDGILNESSGNDGYVVEMKIPFAAIGLVPETGMVLRLDFCVNDIDYSLQGVQSYDDKALRYWPFNWVGYSDFGYPDHWVLVKLVGEPGWLDDLSGSGMRGWFTFYTIALLVTALIIFWLYVRMRKIKTLPLRQNMEASRVVFLKGHGNLDEHGVSENEKIMNNAAEYIRKNYNQNINSELLARELGVSIRKLQRISREELETTPTNFVHMVKLNLAADYLKCHKGNVSQTAYEFGFSDPGYFSRLFKKHFGNSPQEFLEANK